MHFYAWKKGLKTGMYYLRSRPAVNAIQFTVDQGRATRMINQAVPSRAELEQQGRNDVEAAKLACSIENKEACEMCSG